LRTPCADELRENDNAEQMEYKKKSKQTTKQKKKSKQIMPAIACEK